MYMHIRTCRYAQVLTERTYGKQRQLGSETTHEHRPCDRITTWKKNIHMCQPRGDQLSLNMGFYWLNDDHMMQILYCIYTPRTIRAEFCIHSLPRIMDFKTWLSDSPADALAGGATKGNVETTRRRVHGTAVGWQNFESNYGYLCTDAYDGWSSYLFFQRIPQCRSHTARKVRLSLVVSILFFGAGYQDIFISRASPCQKCSLYALLCILWVWGQAPWLWHAGIHGKKRILEPFSVLKKPVSRQCDFPKQVGEALGSAWEK